MDQATIQQLIFQKQTELASWRKEDRSEEIDIMIRDINAWGEAFNTAKAKFSKALAEHNAAQDLQPDEVSRIRFWTTPEGAAYEANMKVHQKEMVRCETERDKIIATEYNPLLPKYRRVKSNIERLETELKDLERQLHTAANTQSQQAQENAEMRDYRNAAEAEAQRAHELEMARLQHETTMAQLEMTRLTAEANQRAQEQASQTLDDMIRATGNGETED